MIHNSMSKIFHFFSRSLLRHSRIPILSNQVWKIPRILSPSILPSLLVQKPLNGFRQWKSWRKVCNSHWKLATIVTNGILCGLIVGGHCFFDDNKLMYENVGKLSGMVGIQYVFFFWLASFVEVVRTLHRIVDVKVITVHFTKSDSMQMTDLLDLQPVP